MRKQILVYAGLAVLLGVGLLQRAGAQDPDFRVAGVGSVPIPVTMDKMTNLIFPEAVQIGVKVSSGILAQKVRGVENVIELKAQQRGFPVTNLSVYGKDGRLYSFVLHYVADSDVLNFRVVVDTVGRGVIARWGPARVIVEGLPVGMTRLKASAAVLEGQKGFLHRQVQVSGIRLRLTGVYFRDSLEWMVIEIGDRTQIPLDFSYSRFSIEDRRHVKRTASQEYSLIPVYDAMSGSIDGHRAVRFAVGFQPFSVPRDKRLRVAVAGADGRTVELTIKSTVLLKAKAE